MWLPVSVTDLLQSQTKYNVFNFSFVNSSVTAIKSNVGEITQQATNIISKSLHNNFRQVEQVGEEFSFIIFLFIYILCKNLVLRKPLTLFSWTLKYNSLLGPAWHITPVMSACSVRKHIKFTCLLYSAFCYSILFFNDFYYYYLFFPPEENSTTILLMKFPIHWSAELCSFCMLYFWHEDSDCWENRFWRKGWE